MNLSERFERELNNSGAMDIYKLIRQKISKLKEICGFKCKMCGTCCTPSPGFLEEDFYFMKKEGANLDGINMWESPRGDLIPTNLKHKGRGNTGICYYEDRRTEKVLCQIHPNNPLICFTFPFVVNLNNKQFFIHKSCTWLEENSEGFAVEVKFAEEIRALIKEYHNSLENYIE